MRNAKCEMRGNRPCAVIRPSLFCASLYPENPPKLQLLKIRYHLEHVPQLDFDETISLQIQNYTSLLRFESPAWQSSG